MVKELRVKSYYQHADGMRNLKNIKRGCVKIEVKRSLGFARS